MRLLRFVLTFFLFFSFCGVFAQQPGSGQDMTFAQFQAQLAPEKEKLLQPFLEQIKDFPAEQQTSFLSRANAAWDTAIEELWAARSSSASQEELDRKTEKIDEKLMRSLNAAFFSLELPNIKTSYGAEAEEEAASLLERFEAGALTAEQFQAQWQQLLRQYQRAKEESWLNEVGRSYGTKAKDEIRDLMDSRDRGEITPQAYQTQVQAKLDGYRRDSEEKYLKQIRNAYGAAAEGEMRTLLSRRSSGAISEAQYRRKSNEILQRYGAQQMSQMSANLHSLLEQEKLQVRNEYFDHLPASIDAKYQRQLNQIYAEKEQAYMQLYRAGLSPEVFTQRAQAIEDDCEKKLNTLFQNLVKDLGPTECRRRDLQRRAGQR